MGRKYIIEIGRLERLYKAFIGAHGKPEITWLSPEVDLTPYTEPDMEQVRKEAYEQGRKDGKIEGQAEAWEAARKIGYSLKSSIVAEIFGTPYSSQIFSGYTASECIEKIRQYEEKEEIRVGDEVEDGVANLIVLEINEDGTVSGFDDEGSIIHVTPRKKTGRHFPEIAEVLRKMKE